MSDSKVNRPTISELEAILKNNPENVAITPAGEVRVESGGAPQCARCKRGISGSFALVGKGAPYERQAMHDLCAAEAECARADQAEAERDALAERVRELEEALRSALDDLSDAKRAVKAWRFTGGMGANIAAEDRGRFPTVAQVARRERAEALLAKAQAKEPR